MREIKFRAWDERGEDSYGQAVTPKYIYDIQNTYDDENGYSFEEVLATPRLILEQFTGLHDKNGKEIYEGDIVKFEDVSGYKDGCASVIWHEDSCGYYLENDDDNIYDTLYDFTPSYQMEIIGNIHENPELLEVTK